LFKEGIVVTNREQNRIGGQAALEAKRREDEEKMKMKRGNELRT